MIFKNSLLFFLCCQILFGEYLVSFVVISLFSVKLFFSTSKKKWLSLYFSFFFLIYSLSFVSYLYVYSPCCSSSYSPRFFSFFSFFSLSMLPLLMFASHYVCLLSLFFLCFFCLFLKNTFIYLVFFSMFSFVHPFLQNCFCSISFIVSHLFLICFFNRVLSNKRNWPFFSWSRKKLFNPSKNLFFLKFCHFMLKKSFIVFRIFWNSLKKKSDFCNFVQKTHKMAFATNNVCPDLIFW